MHHVATALTVYGIETQIAPLVILFITRLQQHLPFTVLKLKRICKYSDCIIFTVATALTVYGIETLKYQILNLGAAYERVATALSVYGMRRRVRDSRGAKRR